MDSRRLDAALVERGLASGREKAKELVRAGGVRITAARRPNPLWRCRRRMRSR